MSTKFVLYNERYIGIKELGKGAFGAAILVKDIKDNTREKVMKEMKLEDEYGQPISPQEIISITQEALTLCRLEHENIIKYYDSFGSTDSYFIVTEYCEGGDLYKRLQSYKSANKKLTNNQIVNWLLELISALEYLHDKMNIVHRDIKSLNVFLKNDILKLGDFGLAAQLTKSDDKKKGLAGTPLYMAPELLILKKASTKTDCWAFGILLYELCTYDWPFKTLEEILQGELPELPDMYHGYLKQIVKGLLDRNQNKRLSISQVKMVLADNMDESTRTLILNSIIINNTKKANDIENLKNNNDEKSLKRKQKIHKYAENVSSICTIM